METGDFSKATVELIAKRAANICSNPDCGAQTCGPADAEDKSLTIGEASHIYGVRQGSARYAALLSASERAASTNAIWLCRNCHKLVDADQRLYSAEILFAWRRAHERVIAERLGKPSELIRLQVLARRLAVLADQSPLAQQIVIDKPRFWEHRLTAELLRHGLEPILWRWQALRKGLYARPSILLPSETVQIWFKTRMDEVSNQAHALAKIMNQEIPSSWGPPGVSGDEVTILRTTGLYIEACSHLLTWEETVRSTMLPEGFEQFSKELHGTAGSVLEQASLLPAELGRIFGQEKPAGEYHIKISFDVPNDWLSRITTAFANGLRHQISGRHDGL
jgi:hypothetical protein